MGRVSRERGRANRNVNASEMTSEASRFAALSPRTPKRLRPRIADSIRAIGPRFYPPELVDVWGAGVTPQLYVRAMEGGEVFFIAVGRVRTASLSVLGFSSHHVDDAQDGISVYVQRRRRPAWNRHGAAAAGRVPCAGPRSDSASRSRRRLPASRSMRQTGSTRLDAAR